MKEWLTDKILIMAIAAPDNDTQTQLPAIEADPAQAQSILAVVFGLAAALAILVIVISGFNLVTGGDDPEKISRAKKTIIFGLVGLAIAVSAEAIVLTVLSRL